MFHLCSPARLQRGLRTAVLAAVVSLVGPAWVQAQGVTATLDNAAATERLLAEFGAWIGNPQEADQLVTALRSGRSTAAEGAASVAPATGPMGYGEARLALKLAQGALAQQGVASPDAAQLQAALHGGTLRTPQGEQVMEGVLPQKAQGIAWAAMAQRYGLRTEDLLPPPGKPVTVKSAKKKVSKGTSKAGTKARTKPQGKAKPGTTNGVGTSARATVKAAQNHASGT